VSGHVIVQRRLGAAQVANLRLALVKKSRFEKMRIPFARMVATHPPRVAEEVVQSRRPRNLLEDNLTSGMMRSEKPCWAAG
jgi:hypothetical protein